MDNNTSDLVQKYYKKECLFEEYDLQNIQNVLHPLLEKLREVKIFKIISNDMQDKINQMQNKQITIKPLNCFENNENQQQIQFPINQNNFEFQSHLNLINQEYDQSFKNKKYQKLGDSLTQEQLQDIQLYGTFTTYSQEGEQQVWQISQSFYTSKTEMEIKYKTKNLLEKYENKFREDTNKRIRSKKWKYSRLSKRYFNFKDGIYTLFYDVPFHLLNCLIGLPVTIQKKIMLEEYLQNNFINIKPEIKYLKKLKLFNQKEIQDLLLSCPIIDLMSDQVKQLKWSEFLFQQKKNLDLYLEIELLKNVLNQNNLKLQKEAYQIFLENILGICIINSFKEKIQQNKSTCVELFYDCLSFLNHYKLESFKKKFLKIEKKFESVSLQKAYKKVHVDSQLASRKKYFWKIKFLWENNAVQICLDGIKDNIMYGYLGIQSLFCKTNAKGKSSTIHEKFQDIKLMVDKRIQKKMQQSLEADEEDDGGIFGDCCFRFPICTCFLNYVFICLIYGIIFTNIILRIIGIFLILLQLFYYFL
ncbi:hypothetical protein ABPG72_018396 [Tetrahymena utriculariae]